MDLSLTYRIPISEQTGRKNKRKGDNYIYKYNFNHWYHWGNLLGIRRGTPNLYTNTNPEQVYGLAKSKKMQSDEI